MKIGWKNTTTPDTCQNAKPVSTKFVENARVIHIRKGGTYRSGLANGTFLIANEPDAFVQNGMGCRVKVNATWFGEQPPEQPHLRIKLDDAEWSEEHHYTGDVVANIARS